MKEFNEFKTWNTSLNSKRITLNAWVCPRKYKYKAEWNDNNNSGFENLIQQRDRNTEENTKWNEDGFLKLNIPIRELS